MVAALHLAENRGLIATRDVDRLVGLLDRLGLPLRWADLDTAAEPDTDRLWEIMQHDKKARGGKVRFILTRALGEVDVFDDVTPEEIARVMKHLTR